MSCVTEWYLRQVCTTHWHTAHAFKQEIRPLPPENKCFVWKICMVWRWFSQHFQNKNQRVFLSAYSASVAGLKIVAAINHHNIPTHWRLNLLKDLVCRSIRWSGGGVCPVYRNRISFVYVKLSKSQQCRLTAYRPSSCDLLLYPSVVFSAANVAYSSLLLLVV